MKYLLTLILCLAFLLPASSQTNEYAYQVKYSPGFDFKPGLYYTSEDFKNNNPSIPAEWLKTDFKRIFKGAEIAYDSLGHTKSITADKIWGFSNGRSIYMSNQNFKTRMDEFRSVNPISLVKWLNEGGWSQINIIGKVCLLLVVKEYYDYSAHTSLQNGNFSKEKKYMLDMDMNELSEFNMKNMLKVVRRDPEFESKYVPPVNKEREKLYYYLMQYNRVHPIYFPE